MESTLVALVADLNAGSYSVFSGEPTEDMVTSSETGDLEIVRYNTETNQYEIFQVEEGKTSWLLIADKYEPAEKVSDDDNSDE